MDSATETENEEGNGHDSQVIEPLPGPSVANLLDGVQQTLKEQVETRPYTTLLVAMAAGYVLGGGVPGWVVRSGVSLGSRMLVSRALDALVDPQTFQPRGG